VNRALAITLALLSCLAGLLPVGAVQLARASEKPACVACEEGCPCCADKPADPSDQEPACPCRPARESSESRTGPSISTIVSSRVVATRTIARRPRERAGYAAIVERCADDRAGVGRDDRAWRGDTRVREVDRSRLCRWVV
jgi:hypothetical protein